MSVNKTVGGAGLTALAAVAAYWMYGKRKQKQSPRGWMLKMKGDVMERLESIKEVNREAYLRAVDQVALRYQRVRKVGADEMKALVRDLRGDWQELSHKVLAGKN